MQEGRFIYLAGFGVEKRLILATAKNIREVFGFEVRFSYITLSPRLGYNPYRRQYHASTILESLSRVHYPDMLKFAALLSFDLYEEGLNFVFGLAQLGGRYAVVSTYRLKSEDERLFFERVFKEVNHELGHTLGLMHCKNKKCVVRFSNSLQDVDAKSRFFCENCSKILPKP
ncbi:archaemetzincin family Zn-dependent metalloprotease [Hydrogenobacter sp. T-2]|uniref:archaemetzincin family Zn-dependent metalloprotease n=1 Tax=Pampinifervens diazotrophicum TaxID=1632018 RepID=UPI002B25E83B|nr:archaemetzincin family Zn-dependent metalloprotease [Hydrogenobacter sp. T-2]WPM31531.1 archaemetzincin family Zn-dependent metalloprotease [Hydrogenobacter sp. T-2]